MSKIKRPETLVVFKDFSRFFHQYSLNQDDLIFTSKRVANTLLKSMNFLGSVLCHDTYGSGEPTDKKIDSLLASCQSLSYKRIFAIGGGTVMDIGKILALENINLSAEAFSKSIPLKKSVPLICIPTTCGTGSEVTNISIMEDTSKTTKVGLADPALLPSHAVLIPALLKGLPKEHFLASSVDALIHAMESYLSPKATEETQRLSLEASAMILGIYKELLYSGYPPSPEQNQNMLLASTLAGLAFGTAGVGAVHALSYPLSGAYHVPHGKANYAFFLAVFSLYEKKDPSGSLYSLNKHLAHCLNVANPQNSLVTLEKLLVSLMPPVSLSSYGVTKNDISQWPDLVLQTQQRLLSNNYVSLSRKDIEGIYEKLH